MAKRKPPESRGESAAKILEAADELVGEGGYEGTSMAGVAARAGVNKALVFYYFNSKAELFERVLERYYQNHLTALTGAFDHRGTMEERMHQVVDAYLDFIDQNRRYPRLIQQMVAGSDEHHELIQRNLQPLFERITELLAEATPANGPLSARHFFVTFSGMVINYFTYAPVFRSMWGDDPMSASALAERRDHLHWMVDTLLTQLRVDNAALTRAANG